MNTDQFSRIDRLGYGQEDRATSICEAKKDSIIADIAAEPLELKKT